MSISILLQSNPPKNSQHLGETETDIISEVGELTPTPFPNITLEQKREKGDKISNAAPFENSENVNLTKKRVEKKEKRSTCSPLFTLPPLKSTSKSNNNGTTISPTNATNEQNQQSEDTTNTTNGQSKAAAKNTNQHLVTGIATKLGRYQQYVRENSVYSKTKGKKQLSKFKSFDNQQQKYLQEQEDRTEADSQDALETPDTLENGNNILESRIENTKNSPKNAQSREDNDKIIRENPPKNTPENDTFIYSKVTSTDASKQTSFTCSALLTSTGAFYEYLQVIIQMGDLPSNVLVLAAIYLKRCLRAEKAMKLIKPAGLKVLYGVCVLLAYKFLFDIDFWPLEQFGLMVGLKRSTLFKYELFVSAKLLRFNYFVNSEDYNLEFFKLVAIGREIGGV